MNKNPNNPFLWYKDKRPSIFAADPMFTPRANGKTNAEMQTESVERRREKGELPGHIDGLGKPSKKREEQLLAYKQFGIYSKAKPAPKKPNIHEK